MPSNPFCLDYLLQTGTWLEVSPCFYHLLHHSFLKNTFNIHTMDFIMIFSYMDIMDFFIIFTHTVTLSLSPNHVLLSTRSISTLITHSSLFLSFLSFSELTSFTRVLYKSIVENLFTET